MKDLLKHLDPLKRDTSLTIVASVFMFCFTTTGYAQSQSTWLSAQNGNWIDPLLWSTNPEYPNNGQPGAADTYNVLIDSVGSPYTVLVDNSTQIVVDQITLDSPDATLLLDGNEHKELTANNGILLEQGLLKMDNASIINTSIGGTNGRIEIPTLGGQNFFEAVSLGVDMTINPRSVLNVNGDLYLDGVQILIEGENSYQGIRGESQASSSRDLTLRGTGQIILTGRSMVGSGDRSTFQVESGIEIMGDARVGFGDAWIRGKTVLNDGLIRMAEGTMTIKSEFMTNTGIIEAVDDASLIVFIEDQTVTTAELGMLRTSNGGEIILRANIDNRGAVLKAGGPDYNIHFREISSNTATSILGGRIEGTIGTNDSFVELGFVELSGVTLATGVSGSMIVSNGMVMDGGRIALKSGTWARFDGGQDITGQGVIEVATSSISNYNYLGHEGDGQVRFGPDVQLNIKSSRLNAHDAVIEGTVLFDGDGPTSGAIAGSFVTHGQVQVESRGGLGGNNYDKTYVNEGNIVVEAGGELGLGNRTVNNGTITLRPGSRLEYYGDNTIQAFGSIVNEGAEIELNDSFDLLGQTLDFFAMFGAQKSLLEFSAVEFKNGRMLDTSGDLMTFANGRDSLFFSDIEFASDVSLFSSNRAYLAGDIVIPDGVTMYLGLVPEGIVDTPNSSIRGNDAEGTLISGGGEIVIANGSTNSGSTEIQSNPQAELIIGPDMVIRTEGQAAFTFEAINRGLIQLNGANDILHLDWVWRNEGVIQADAGQVWLDGTFTPDRVGTIRGTPETELYIIGQFDLNGQTFNFPGNNGEQWYLNWRGRALNGRIETINQPLRIGVFDNNTSYNGWGELESVTLAGQVIIDNRGELRLYDHLTLDGGRLHVGFSNLIEGEPVISDGELVVYDGDFLLDGQGEIIFTGGSEMLLANYSGTSNPLFTVGQGVTLKAEHGAGTINIRNVTTRNLGVFASDEGGLRVEAWGLYFDNSAGILEAKNNGSVRIQGLTGDAGTLRFMNKGRIELDGDYTLVQDINLGDGEVLNLKGNVAIDSTLTVGTGARVEIEGDWINGGLIDLQGGLLQIDRPPAVKGPMNLGNGQVRLNGLFTTDDMLALPFENTTVQIRYGGVISNDTKLINVGVDVGALELWGGRIEGGFIDSSVGASLIATSATSRLLDVNILSTVEVQNGSHLNVEDSIWASPLVVGPGSSLALEGNAWENQGGVAATDGMVRIHDMGTTLGTFNLTRSMLVVATNLDEFGQPVVIPAQMLVDAVTANQGVIALENGANIDTQGYTIDLDDNTLSWRLEGGTMRGGVVRPLLNEVLGVAGGGLLDGVRVNAPLRMEQAGTLEMEESSVAGGRLTFTHDGSGIAAVSLGSNQTLAGFGDIQFRAGSVDSNLVEKTTGSLDIPAGMTISAVNGGGGTVGSLTTAVTNRGTLLAEGPGSVLRVRGSTLYNLGGTLRVTDFGVLDLQWFAGDAGNVELEPSGKLFLNGVYTFNTPTTVENATLSLTGAWSMSAPLVVKGSQLFWHNTPFTGKDFLAITDSDVFLMAPALPSSLPASLANNNNRLTLRRFGSLNLDGQNTSGLGIELHLDGGTLRNARIDDSSNVVLKVRSSATFREITIASDLIVPSGTTLELFDTEVLAVNLTGGPGNTIVVPTSRNATLASTQIKGMLQNAGTLFVSGAVALNGDYSQAFSGDLALGIETLAGGGTNSDSLQVDGLATLAGDITIVATAGRDFAFMDRFEVLDLNHSIGWFHTATLPDLPDGLFWDNQAFREAGLLIVVAGPGDTNGDGLVNRADLTLVMNGFGQQVAPYDRTAGDLTGDGLVGIADLDAVLANWHVLAPAAPQSVPEPASLGILTLLLLLLSNRRMPVLSRD